MLSQPVPGSTSSNSSGGHGTCTSILWEKRVVSSPLSVLPEPVWLCFTITVILREAFKMLKLRSRSYKGQKRGGECVKISYFGIL